MLFADPNGFVSKELAGTSWAFAKLEIVSSTLLDMIAAEATVKMTEFSTSNLANISWSIANVQGDGGQLFEAISQHAAPRRANVKKS